MATARKEYPLELKRRVVDRVESGELTAAVAAHEYGLRVDQVKHWLTQFGAAPGGGVKTKRSRDQKQQLTLLEAEVKRLKKELEKAEAERDFLKKAASYFARATP